MNTSPKRFRYKNLKKSEINSDQAIKLGGALRAKRLPRNHCVISLE